MIKDQKRGPIIPFTLAFLGLLLAYFAKPLLLGQHFSRGDTGADFYPNRLFLAESIRNGDIPLWNPLLFCGTPFLANPLHSFFYPPNWLFVLLPKPASVWILLIFHLTLGGLGTAYLSKEVTKSENWASFCGGFVYAFSGYWCMHMGHFTQVMVGAWAPWVMVAGVRWMRAPSPGRFATLAALFAVQWLPGGTENVTYFAWTLVCLALIHMAVSSRSVPSGWWARLGPGLGILSAMIFGACLAGAQLVPTFEFTLYSTRWGGMAFEYAGKHSLPPWRPPIELIIPNFGGHFGPTPTVTSEIPHPEMVVYIGPVAFLFALLAAVKEWSKPPLRFCTVLTLMTLVLAFGRFTPFYHLLYGLGFSFFRNPARATYLVTLGLALLCAAGLQRFLSWERLPLAHRKHRWAICALAAGGAALLLMASRPAMMGIEKHTRPWVYVTDLGFTLLCLALGYAAMVVQQIERRKVLLFLSLALPLFAFSRESEFLNLPTEKRERTENRKKLVDSVRENLGPYRVFSQHCTDLDSNHLVPYGLPDVTGIGGGLNPLRRYWQLQQEMKPDSHLSRTLGRRFLDLLGGRIILYDYESEDDDLRLLARFGDYYAYLNPFARPRLTFVPKGTVRSDEEVLQTIANGSWNPDSEVFLNEESLFFGNPKTGVGSPLPPRLAETTNDRTVCEIYAPTKGYLVLTDTFYPGWEVSVDGEPAKMLRANYLFRAVALVPGSHRVVFEYHPSSVTAGLCLSGIATLVLLCILLRGKKKAESG